MKSKFFSFFYGLVLAGTVALTLPGAAHAQRTVGKIQAADPNERSDGTMSRAAAMAMRGELRIKEADVALKAAANRAVDEELQGLTTAPQAAPAFAPPPVIVGDHNFFGLGGGPGNFESPSDVTGAIGPNSYIQAGGSRIRIFNRNNHNPIADGPLNQLFGVPANANSFDPQVLYDAQTGRWIVAGVSAVSETDNRLVFAFSRNANPDSLTNADFCPYAFPFGSFVLSDVRLGDSQHFLTFGFNSFDPQGTFLGSDLGAVSKPPPGAGCPPQSTFRDGFVFDIRNSSNQRIINPVPSNQIDNNHVGFFVIRNGTLPSNRLWFINVTRDAANGDPLFGDARGLTVPRYTVPPDARQPGSTRLLDTGDGSPTQAVQAINPDRGSVHSFFIAHAVKNRNASGVRWYEINPAPANPVLLRTGMVNCGNSLFCFNPAISPDRQRNGNTRRFGDSFVINFNASSNSVNPGIRAVSSVNGGPLSGIRIIQNGAGPYRDFTCPGAKNTCRWGDYSGANPDPVVPGGADHGVVWGTNQFGRTNPPANGANWRTRIFALTP